MARACDSSLERAKMHLTPTFEETYSKEHTFNYQICDLKQFQLQENAMKYSIKDTT